MYGIAPKLPLTVSHSEGILSTKDLKENVQQNLKNLILTSPGERVMDIEFGVGLRNYLFLNFGESNLEYKITEQVERYMSYVEITDLEITEDPDHGVLTVQLVYSISDVISDQTLSLTIDPKLMS
jgi:phage baseplate assembly protein W